MRSFSELVPGTALGPLRLTVSNAANERYWRAAGIDHPALAAGALYPPIAANLTVLCFAQVCPEAMIQTEQLLRCHRRVSAGVDLVTTGVVAQRYEKRGRTYVDVETTVVTADAPHDPVWTSAVSFTPAATLGAAP
ncbi:MAG: hypothetical protein QOH28_2662 [Actinomycetota bacterium]|jgi:hypothetical protein|nr:hypothetical protein [Actinomycetota bacterium]